MKVDLSLSLEKLHERGWQAREEERFEEALVYLELAVKKAIEGEEWERLVDVLKDRCLTWKHLFLVERKQEYGWLAERDAEMMLVVAEARGLAGKLGTAHFRLGEIAMVRGDYEKAVKEYRLALKYYRGSRSEKGDYRYHLGEAVYRWGEKSEGERLMLEGVEEIRHNMGEVDEFLS